jgi:hypothetical protein
MGSFCGLATFGRKFNGDLFGSRRRYGATRLGSFCQLATLNILLIITLLKIVPRCAGRRMMFATYSGLDLVHGVPGSGIEAVEKVVVRKQFRRSQVLAFFKALPPCLICVEDCPRGAFRVARKGHPDRWPRSLPLAEADRRVRRRSLRLAERKTLHLLAMLGVKQ